MNIKPLKGFWVCVNVRDEPQLKTIAYGKRDSIDKFLQDTAQKHWKSWEKEYGYKCIKVNISFEPVVKK